MEMLTVVFENIARHLWTVSWQVAVITAVVAVVDLVARKASPLFRYGLWMIVLVRLAVPVAFTVPESAERMVRGVRCRIVYWHCVRFSPSAEQM